MNLDFSIPDQFLDRSGAIATCRRLLLQRKTWDSLLMMWQKKK